MKALKISSTDDTLTFEKFYWTPNEYQIRLKGENFPTMYVNMKEDKYETSIAENCVSFIKDNNIVENYEKIKIELVEVENSDRSDLIKLPVNYQAPISFDEKISKAKNQQSTVGHEMFDFESEYHNL